MGDFQDSGRLIKGEYLCLPKKSVSVPEELVGEVARNCANKVAQMSRG